MRTINSLTILLSAFCLVTTPVHSEEQANPAAHSSDRSAAIVRQSASPADSVEYSMRESSATGLPQEKGTAYRDYSTTIVQSKAKAAESNEDPDPPGYKFAVMSLVFGCMGLLGAPFAIIFGIVALRKLERGEKGRVLANVGILLGVINLVIAAVVVVLLFPNLLHSIGSFFGY